MSTNKKILFLDWGIGGLSVYREFKRLHPHASCVYVSDSGFAPYGKVPTAELADRVLHMIQKFKAEISQTVIACNAASTILPLLAGKLDVPVCGMIESGIELVKSSGQKKIGVIGGQRTIESKVFSVALTPIGFLVTEQVAQPLSAMIEAGELEGERLTDMLQDILAPIGRMDALLLACTHYPAISPVLQKILPDVLLLDPARRVAESLVDIHSAHEADVFFTTGSVENSSRAAKLAFAVEAPFRAMSG